MGRKRRLAGQPVRGAARLGIAVALARDSGGGFCARLGIAVALARDSGGAGLGIAVANGLGIAVAPLFRENTYITGV